MSAPKIKQQKSLPQNIKQFKHPPLLEAYLAHLTVERGLSENTLLAYTSDLEDFLSFSEKHTLPLH